MGNSDLSIIILDRNVNPSEVDIVTLSMNDYLKEADIDGNGFVNFLDISPFINLFWIDLAPTSDFNLHWRLQ